MIKKLYSYVHTLKGGSSFPIFQDVAQGFNTSLENVLKGSINDTNGVREMKGTENELVTLYNNDVLDFETSFQRKFTENLIEGYKQTHGAYDVDNQQVENLAPNSETTETVKNEKE